MSQIILLAALDPDFRKSYKDLFENEGFTVDTADSVGQAIETMELLNGCLGLKAVLVDLHFDKDYKKSLGGLEIIIRARDLGIPCVVIYDQPLATAFVNIRECPNALLNAVNLILPDKPKSVKGGKL